MNGGRILIWYWSGGGGGGQFAVRLAHKLATRFGADSVALSLRADDPAREAAAALNLSTQVADICSDRRKPLMTAAQLVSGARILREHARGVRKIVVPMNFALAAPLSLQLDPPKLVYCAHDPEPHPGDYAQRAQRWTQSILFARAAHVVALSHASRAQLPKLRAQVHVAPLSSVFAPQSQGARLAGPVHLLFAGRMIAYKGLGVLADALMRIADRDDWRLTLVGDGPALDEAMLARFRMQQVTLARRAWLSDAELEQHIAACDVLLAPYLSATQSGPIAQALAYGKPCIVTPVSALPEQIGCAPHLKRGLRRGAYTKA
jgi:glycosyltransferase involved in cell wall biosynthesis